MIPIAEHYAHYRRASITSNNPYVLWRPWRPIRGDTVVKFFYIIIFPFYGSRFTPAGDLLYVGACHLFVGQKLRERPR